MKHTPIPGWPGYFATEDGRVWSATGLRGVAFRALVPVLNGKGYWKVRLVRDGHRHNIAVHKIIAATFLPPRPSPSHEVRHVNGDEGNNAADNLAWGTRKDNADDRERHGRTSRGITHSAAIRRGLERRYAV